MQKRSISAIPLEHGAFSAGASALAAVATAVDDGAGSAVATLEGAADEIVLGGGTGAEADVGIPVDAPRSAQAGSTSKNARSDEERIEAGIGRRNAPREDRLPETRPHTSALTSRRRRTRPSRSSACTRCRC